MTKTAAVAFEIRWRKNSDPSDLWSTPAPVGADGHVSVPGLARVTDYTFEARAISACGAKSAWATQTFTMPDVGVGTLTLAGIQSEAAQAQTDANAANAELANIASDNILSPAEKPTVMRDYSVITTEQAGIDAQATQYGITTQKSDYDNAISTLTAYLNTLNTPTAWNNKSGDTDIVGSTFRGYFNSVYTTRQTLLNAIYTAAKTLANNAQSTANTANTAAGNAQSTANTASAARGRNIIANPGFELNSAGTPLNTLLAGNAACGDGWVVEPFSYFPVLVTSTKNSGNQSVSFTIGNGTVIPNGTASGAVQSVGAITVDPKATYIFGAHMFWNSNYAWPAGVTADMVARIQFFDAGGNQLGQIAVSAGGVQGFNNFGGAPLTATGTVPAGAVRAQAQCYVVTNNTTGAAITIPAGNNYPMIAYLDDLFCYALAVLDTDTMDGTVYGRLANADIFQSGGVNRLGLRIPGSGHTVGDQRNLLPVTWAGVRSVLSTSPISFSISGTTVNVSVAAVTVNAGGVNVSYNASSGSVTQAAGTTVTYYCYYRDATSAGGSQSLYITTSVQALAAYPDIVLLGNFSATVASGGGGSGGTGGGGGGYCVADDMFIGEGRRAGDADIGDPFDCIDLPTAAGKHVRALQGVSRGIEGCVRMITSDGCALVCSASTPFDLPDGRQTIAPRMLGEQVITDLGTATVISLALVGPLPVTRAHLGGVSYAAGADPARRIYSHNVGQPSKP